MSFQNIGILNTSIATENAGDFVIMDSAMKELMPIAAGANFYHFPTHEKLSSTSYGIQSIIDFNIACGTNLLHAHMGFIRQWNISLRDCFRMKPVVLMGVGWRSQAKRNPDLYTRWVLKKILSGAHQHSVRDSYSLNKLKSCGITNVINTGCHTLWCLTEDHCHNIPRKKGTDVVLTLTDYSKNPELDSQLVRTALEEYEKVYFWSQGSKDVKYIQELGLQDRLIMLPNNLLSYDRILSDKSISLDYIGTRLHGGIRALQHSRRSIIVGVDHRANVMGADFHLPVIDRYSDNKELVNLIKKPMVIDVQLPLQNIARWKNQFLKQN